MNPAQTIFMIIGIIWTGCAVGVCLLFLYLKIKDDLFKPTPAEHLFKGEVIDLRSYR